MIAFSIPFCSQIENLLSGRTASENPLPSWIKSIDSSFSNTNLVNVIVDEGELWELGDDVTSLGEQISRSLTIKVDGVVLPRDSIFVLDTFEPPTNVYDANGEIIGSHNGLITIVFEVFVPPGIHTATLEVTGTSGKVFSYSWELEVPETISPP